MADKLAIIKAAIVAAKDIIHNVSGVYDEAMNFYGKFEGATNFKDRHRSLELALVNGTKNDIEFHSEYFDSGTWFVSPQPILLKSGDTCMMFVADRQGSVATGVTGGVKWTIKGTGKFLYLGFTNPQFGSYKNFIDVKENGAEPAKYGYDNSHDDTVKLFHNRNGYRISCNMREPKISPFKLFEYTIMETEETK